MSRTTLSRPSLPPVRRPGRIALVAALLLAIPAFAFAEFVDVSSSSLFNEAKDVTYGLGWGDFENDGDPDLFVVRHYWKPIIYRNGGDGILSFSFNPPLFDARDHHGPLIEDFDGDGDLDVYVTGGADAGMSSTGKVMYRNDGNYAFVDVAESWAVDDADARGRSASAIDLESDGDVDFFVAKAPRVISPNSLFLNDGSQGYTDIAAAAGVADDFGSVGGLWIDYDGDADPDLLIGGEEQPTFETRIYRNEGDLTFTDVTSSILPGIGTIASAGWGDYDNDGDFDLCVGLGDEALFDAVTWGPDSVQFFFNARGADDGLDGFAFLQTGDSTSYDIYLNGFYQPDLIFIGQESLHPGPLSPFVLPFDIIGAPLFFPGQSTGYYLWTSPALSSWELRANAPPGSFSSFAGKVRPTNGVVTAVSETALEPYSHGPRGVRLYRNDDGSFLEVTFAAGLADSGNVRHLTWVDYDLDGALDLFVLNKGDTELFNQPNVLYRNLGHGTFQDVTAEEGMEGPTAGLGDACAFEDYDADGDLDLAILSGSGPRYFALQERHRLYRNDGPTGNRVRVKLAGTRSTRRGLGSLVTCTSASTGVQTRYVAANAWRGAQEMVDPFFGIGPDVLATVVVSWPSGAVSTVPDVAPGTVVVVEPDPPMDAPGTAPPSATALSLAASPVPSRFETVLSWSGRREAEAELAIWDAAGRRVRRWDLAPGNERVTWDGRDEGGGRVAAGVYFARLREETREARAKIVLLP